MSAQGQNRKSRILMLRKQEAPRYGNEADDAAGFEPKLLLVREGVFVAYNEPIERDFGRHQRGLG